MALGGRQATAQVGEIVREVDLLDGPGVLDGGLVHLEEHRVLHGTQSQIESWIQDHDAFSLNYWQASQFSGFSREQATAEAASAIAGATSLSLPGTGFSGRGSALAATVV